MSNTEVAFAITFVLTLTAGLLALALTRVVGWLSGLFYRRHK